MNHDFAHIRFAQIRQHFSFVRVVTSTSHVLYPCVLTLLLTRMTDVESKDPEETKDLEETNAHSIRLRRRQLFHSVTRISNKTALQIMNGDANDQREKEFTMMYATLYQLFDQKMGTHVTDMTQVLMEYLLYGSMSPSLERFDDYSNKMILVRLRADPNFCQSLADTYDQPFARTFPWNCTAGPWYYHEDSEPELWSTGSDDSESSDGEGSPARAPSSQISLE